MKAPRRCPVYRRYTSPPGSVKAGTAAEPSSGRGTRFQSDVPVVLIPRAAAVRQDYAGQDGRRPETVRLLLLRRPIGPGGRARRSRRFRGRSAGAQHPGRGAEGPGAHVLASGTSTFSARDWRKAGSGDLRGHRDVNREHDDARRGVLVDLSPYHHAFLALSDDAQG